MDYSNYNKGKEVNGKPTLMSWMVRIPVMFPIASFPLVLICSSTGSQFIHRAFTDLRIHLNALYAESCKGNRVPSILPPSAALFDWRWCTSLRSNKQRQVSIYAPRSQRWRNICPVRRLRQIIADHPLKMSYLWKSLLQWLLHLRILWEEQATAALSRTDTQGHWGIKPSM